MDNEQLTEELRTIKLNLTKVGKINQTGYTVTTPGVESLHNIYSATIVQEILDITNGSRE